MARRSIQWEKKEPSMIFRLSQKLATKLKEGRLSAVPIDEKFVFVIVKRFRRVGGFWEGRNSCWHGGWQEVPR
jgi:hypothetical protein